MERSDLSTVILSLLTDSYGAFLPGELARIVAKRTGQQKWVVLEECRRLVQLGKLELQDGKFRGRLPHPAHPPFPMLGSDFARSLFGHSEITADTASRWDFFRQLLGYYQECLRFEEGASTSAAHNQLGRLFCYLKDFGRTMPGRHRVWRARIFLSGESSRLSQLWQNPDSTNLVLGYPLSAWHLADAEGKSELYIAPIFCYALDFHADSLGITVSTRTSMPTVNDRCLKYIFRNSDARRFFLESCGFMSGFNEDGLAPGLDELCIALKNAASKNIREPIDPRHLGRTPLLEEAEDGIWNRAVVMVQRASPYVKTLLEELEMIGRATNEVLSSTVLASIFADEPAVSRPSPETQGETTGHLAETVPLDGAQRRAAASLVDNRLTVIQGPPGTGKSQVISAVAANERLQNRSVLISSYNHAAIDAVMNKLLDADGKPLAVRCNAKDTPYLSFGMQDALSQMLSMHEKPAAKKQERRLESMREMLAKRGELTLQADRIRRLAERLEELEGRILDLERDSALVHRLIEGSVSVRGIKGKHSSRRWRSYADLLSRAAAEGRSPFAQLFLEGAVLSLPSFLSAFRSVIRTFSLSLSFWKKGRCEEIEKVVAGMRSVAQWNSLRQEAKEIERNITLEKPCLEEIEEQIRVLTQSIAEAIPDSFKADAVLRSAFPSNQDRAKLGATGAVLAQCMDATPPQAKAIFASNTRDIIRPILASFPVWAVSSLSVRRYIPLSPALFDLVLIDEAGYSNIPSAIPLLFRASRAGIIGDPQQLRFVSKLSRSQDTLLARTLNFSSMEDFRYTYSGRSIYDLARESREAAFHLLDCSYRSAGPLAEYSSQLSYGGLLRTGTDESRLKRPAGSKGSIEWHDVSGQVLPAGRSCWCKEEVQEVVAIVKQLLSVARFDGSVGVVTPFREQAQRIRDDLEVCGILRDVRERARLDACTVNGIQGDERDVMIFSLCAGEGMPAGSLTVLRRKEELFNVAVSRSRAMLYVVGDKAWAGKCGIPHVELLTKIGTHVQRKQRRTPWYPYESPYEKILAEALQKAGLDPKPQVPVHSRRLDLALIDPRRPMCRLDIEIDGQCHRAASGRRKGDDIWRDLEMEAAGWRVLRFWTYAIREDCGSCVRRVVDVWQEMQTHAESESASDRPI